MGSMFDLRISYFSSRGNYSTCFETNCDWSLTFYIPSLTCISLFPHAPIAITSLIKLVRFPSFILRAARFAMDNMFEMK